MLTTLRIKNLALVADLTLELQPGLNVITGETGAGKSILIGALSLVLGERADRTLIRSGADSCAVEAVFAGPGLPPSLGAFLDANGLEPCEEGQLVLKRTFTAAGANRQFINGSPTTLQILGLLGEGLVDIHGPHDHQSLLHAARQLTILDAFARLTPQVLAFGERVRQRGALLAEKTALIVDEQTYAQQLDLLRFQVREIREAQLQTDEERQVEEEHRRARNAVRLLELSQTALGLIDGEDSAGLLSQAGSLGRTLQELQRLDAASGPVELGDQMRVPTCSQGRTGTGVHPVQQPMHLGHAGSHRVGAVGVEVEECCHGTILYRTNVRVKSKSQSVDTEVKPPGTATTTVE